MSCFDQEVANLRAKLKSDAEECADLLRCLDETHNGIAGRVPGLRLSILDSMAPSHARIVEALSIVRDAHAEVSRAAIKEAELLPVLHRIKRQLADAQIHLIEL